ncbi:MAG: MarR family winged helix-turn-helix transcriptional regulator [Beijerinckiaceae bacterium]
MELNKESDTEARPLADMTTAGLEGVGAELLARQRLDAFTHARLWRNPCGFAARFNYLGLRYNTPLYNWVEERFDLSRADFVVIYSLALMDGVTASEIAASTAFPKNTLSRAVNRLAKRGLIRRSEGESDRRQQNLTLTPKGRAVYDEALPRFEALENEMLSSLTLVERETLSALMAKVVLAMFEPSAEHTRR